MDSAERSKYLIIAFYVFDKKQDTYCQFIQNAKNIPFTISSFVDTDCKYDKLNIYIIKIDSSIELNFDKNY